MPRLIDTESGESIVVSDSEVGSLVDSGLYQLAEGERVAVETSAGVRAAVDPLSTGGKRALTPGEVAEEAQAYDVEAAYGDQGARTLFEGGLSGLTAGGSEILARIANVNDPLSQRARSGRAEANRAERLIGEVGGGALPGLLSGGTGTAGALARLTPAGRAAAIGESIAARGAGKGLLGRATAQGAGMAAEGGIVGLGEGVAELALSEDPADAERAVAVLGSRMLFGAGVGGALGSTTTVVARAAEKGLERAKKIADEAVERIGSQSAGVAEDLATLDRKGLREAKAVELERLGEAATKEKAAIADEVARYYEASDGSGKWLATENKEIRKVWNDSKKALRRHTTNPQGLAKNPIRALDSLQREAEATKRAIAESKDMLAKLAEHDAKLADDLALELATLPDDAAEVVLGGKLASRYSDFADVKLVKKQATLTREDAEAFLGAMKGGDVKGARAKAIENLDSVLKQNEAIQARIERAYQPPASDRLAAIEDAVDNLTTGAKKGLLEQVVEGSAFSAVTGAVAPIAGPAAPFIGAKVAGGLSALLSKRIGAATAESAQRMSTAIDGLLSISRKRPRAATVSATRVLSRAAFAPEGASYPRALAPVASRLATAYRQREREILGQVQASPSGAVELTPAARQRVADQFSAVRLISPKLADRMETAAARRIEFLASKMPKRPDMMAAAVGPDRWHPSHSAMASFARYVAATEDPAGVVERAAAGTMTPEDAEALRSVYPEIFADLQREILGRLPELRASLPYARRVSLSILLDVPVDPAMDPEILSTLQGSYAEEPGTDGGTMAPRAAPQFGSIKKSLEEPTRAQERAG